VRTALQNISGFDGVVVGVPVKDTIKEVADSIVKRTLKRETLWAIQDAPGLYSKDPRKGLPCSYGRKILFHDDAALLERSGGKVKIIMVRYLNIKITTPEDIPLAEHLLKSGKEQKMRIGGRGMILTGSWRAGGSLSGGIEMSL